MTCHYYKTLKDLGLGTSEEYGKCGIMSDDKYFLIRPLEHCRTNKRCGIYKLNKSREKARKAEYAELW